MKIIKISLKALKECINQQKKILEKMENIKIPFKDTKK